MPDDSPEMSRLRSARDVYAQDVTKAERDAVRAQNRLESARLKLAVADDMISKVQKDAGVNVAAFNGMGKYGQMPVGDAILDIVNHHAGLEGMSVNEVLEILVNEGVPRKQHLSVAIHVTTGRLAKKNLIRVEKNENGKRFFKLTQPEEPRRVAA
jgi:hypothetical protein